MRTSAHRWALLFGAAVFVLSAGGCFHSRAALYSEIAASRQLAYERWQEASGEESLPKIDGKLGIGDAVRVALAYSKALQLAVQAKEVARGMVVEAYGEGLPTIEFDADYTRLDMVSSFDVGGTTVSLGDVDNYSAQFKITQPLFKGAVLPAIRGAQIFRYISDESVRRAVQDVILSVANAYYSVLLADELYQVQEAALKFAEANLQDVQAREKQGVAIRYDELRARLEVSTVKADLIRQRNARSRAMTALLRTMGASQQSNVELTDQLAYEPMEISFERAVQTAFTNRPDIISGELDVRLQREILLGRLSDYLPKIEGWALTGWAKPDPHDTTKIRWNDQWQAGLRLTWILFDGLSREGKIIQQKALARQSAIALSDTEQKLIEDVKNAILDLADADELVQSQQLNLEQANEALRLVQVGAREGVNTELEMLDARSALTRARGLYYQALFAHVTARLALQRALGIMGPGPGVGEVPKEGPPLGQIKGPEEPAAAQPATQAGQTP
jgi:outer membrane protein TolC